MKSIEDLLLDSRFWAAILLVLNVVLPYLGVKVPIEVWAAIDGLVAAVLVWLSGKQARTKYLCRKKCSSTCCPDKCK